MASRAQPNFLTRARWSLARAIAPGGTKAVQKKQGFQLVWPDYRLGSPQWHTINFEDFCYYGLELNAVVASAVMYKQRAIAAAPLRAYQGDPLSAMMAPVEHPLQRLAARPNSVQTGIELCQLLTCYYNIAGNAYCVVDRKGQQIKGLYSVRPDRVYIVPEERGGITFWYQPEGVSASDTRSMVPILMEDMLHLKMPNPRDPLEGFGYGLSPLRPAGRSIDVHNEVTDYLKLFFEHAGVPPGQIVFEELVGEDYLESVKERWMEKHGGVTHWPEPAVFEAGGKYEPVALPFDKMGFAEIDQRTETLILGPLGVPPILTGMRSGLERSTFSNYEEARKACWEDTLEPELTQFGGEFVRVRMGDAWLGFDLSSVPALVERNRMRAETFEKLYAQGMAYPIDQAAQIAGLPAPVFSRRQEESTPAGQTTAEEEGEPKPAEAEGGGKPAEEAAPEPEKALVSLWTADSIAAYQRIQAVLEDERKAALKAGRTIDWKAVGQQWETVALMQPHGGELGRMLVSLADGAYNNLWTADQMRKRLRYAVGEKVA